MGTGQYNLVGDGASAEAAAVASFLLLSPWGRGGVFRLLSTRPGRGGDIKVFGQMTKGCGRE